MVVSGVVAAAIQPSSLCVVSSAHSTNERSKVGKKRPLERNLFLDLILQNQGTAQKGAHSWVTKYAEHFI
jgi:hypothetical protein